MSMMTDAPTIAEIDEALGYARDAYDLAYIDRLLDDRLELLGAIPA
ncbi:hypothetical protein UFOVP1183_30 [uncultured Caudovirales phage]|uniref:Uncharacterized protein n=1 Tax=uncultured Caudovirales phage TaxID=2100421 RepID=A0A6J5R448_9CAUD|nr:hypothetical protein UFOVP955_2 [uncultured Caudovirales phage]CAB4185323.1 hypothetical protein UFOVP1120_36 [uncultured Caudovirales phage]CAB4188388.1 hypothetical protein UFOVP1183_30 [uncultured Caudovirales phage]CAB4191100.1 hypothetical protein UFOVP1227_13 [uncultured Caudovirales phage]CAB5230023.1 hypothetical protein UFOVP1571_36 [uncultured Caudovirales phage]